VAVILLVAARAADAERALLASTSHPIQHPSVFEGVTVAGAVTDIESAPLSADAPPAWTTRSLLMVDIGSAHTKAGLIGVVEGRYRLLARAQAATTFAPPTADVAVGVCNAIADLERISGRALLRDGRLLTSHQEEGGVDGLALATSTGGPLRVLTGGPGREALAALLHRAIGGMFVLAEALPTLPAALPFEAFEWQQALAQVRALQPHALLMVGSPFGAARSSSTLEEWVALASRWLDALRATPGASGARESLPFVFTGNADDARLVAASLQGPQGRAAALQTVEPLTPSTLLPLSRAVSSLYEGAVLRTQPGYASVRSLATVPPTACITALSGMVRYLAQHFQTNVVGVDVGASSTSVVGATVHGEFLPAAQPMAGVGAGAGAVLRERGPQAILRWLSAPGSEEEVREYVLTRMLRPHALPASRRELELEHALAREALVLALRAPGARIGGLHPLDVVLGTGSVLANAPHPALAALILLDALQPRGITSQVLDVANIANMLGGVAALDSAAAADVAENDAVLLQLGTFISPVGPAPEGQPALRVVLEYADGRKYMEDVPSGSIARFPLAPSEQAILGLLPAETVDVGLGLGQQARASEPVEGGALGVVIDARGRPLALPQDPIERAARQAEWRRALGVEE
jgi:hypothetical protein